jgi:hypothetical protein
MFQWFVDKYGHGNTMLAFVYILALGHFIVIVVSGLISAYRGVLIGEYLKKNHYELWKMGGYFWIPTRLKAQKLINDTDDSVLKIMLINQEKCIKIGLYALLSAVVLFSVMIIILAVHDIIKNGW